MMQDDHKVTLWSSYDKRVTFPPRVYKYSENIVKTSHDDLAMHLRKRHGDRKVPALTSCDVFGRQTLRLPYDDPKECEQTKLAPQKTCDA